MKTAAASNASPALARLDRIASRLDRLEFVMDRDKDDKARMAAHEEELEALNAEKIFLAFKAK